MKLIILLPVLWLASVGVTQAASFACERAETKKEKTICEQHHLNDAEVKMATTYKIVKRLFPMGTRSVIQDEQVKWLRLRNECGDSVQCLTDVYQLRQQKLEIYLERVYQKGPF